MKSSFRWYGESDPVKLEYIRQIPGMRSIVSAVYDVKPGEVWPEESIRHLTELCREHGLIFDVVESIPVTEEIKLGKPEREQHIQNYCESVRRCAKYGIKCITYNFMPVFDWTRTQLDKMAEDRCKKKYSAFFSSVSDIKTVLIFLLCRISSEMYRQKI